MLFQEERFGLFVHFGIYAVGAFHEQEQWRRNVPPEVYQKYMQAFSPLPGCTDLWARAARDAGMQYLCLTAKHHDGFCLWDTKTTDYSVLHTPCGRDLVAETAESCRKYGLRFALYYSLPDWHCPFAVQGGDHALPKQNPGDTPSWTLYKSYLRAQIRELLTGYGRIDALFWDIPAPADQYDPSVNAFVRSLQPDILINDRGFSEGDYKTPERTVPNEPFSGRTEACQSVGAQSWGYRAHEDYFSHAFLIRSIDRVLQKGGNYLLNVGPMADGSLPTEAEASLRAVGDWFRRTREAFFDTEFFCHPALENLPATISRDHKTLYLHLPGDKSGIVLPQIQTMPMEVITLNDRLAPSCTLEYTPDQFHGYPTDGPLAMPKALHIYNLPVNRFPSETLILRLRFNTPLTSHPRHPTLA